VSNLRNSMVEAFQRVGPQFLPFADAATAELPLSRLLRLSLFQVTVGLATVLLIGTLNRVLIVEMGVSASLVALMVALPLLVAPFRALLGHRSDHHRSFIGWRRVPYLWMGTLLQFGGLAIMPFALILLSGDSRGPAWIGDVAAALAFLMVGAGLQTAQTAGLALATDLATPETRPRVVSLMYVMLLLGMVGGGFAYGALLANFSPFRLIQVVQGTALLTMVLNALSMWKQEPRNPHRASIAEGPTFLAAWRDFTGQPQARRFLVTVALGTAAFSMQDIILEPYGGEVLGLSVGQTTALTAIMATGNLAAFALAARWLSRGTDPLRLSAFGALAGVFAFAGVVFSGPLGLPDLFRASTLFIGFGAGLFAVGTLASAMERERNGASGLALGAWGAVQAVAIGTAIATGGVLRDTVAGIAATGALGTAMQSTDASYGVVYHVEIGLLFLTLVALGPLVAAKRAQRTTTPGKFGMAELPG
jgi:MFS transporter, BCD family, chlorophyll transporter